MPIDPDNEPDLTPYQRAESWLYMMWMDVYHKCMAMIEEKIKDAGGTLGGGGGKREFGYQMPGELAAGMSGPSVPNILGETITFTKAKATVGEFPVDADITCELDIDGTVVSFTISDGTTASSLQTGLSIAWADGTLITGSISGVGSSTPGAHLSMVLSE